LRVSKRIFIALFQLLDLMSDRKILEAVADIAYTAGHKKYTSGDSRQDISDFIWWAEEFEKIHLNTDWGYEDYILKIDEFTRQKIREAVRDRRR